MTKPECAVEVCARPTRKGSPYCEAHYRRLLRTGSPAGQLGNLEIHVPQRFETCIVSDCDKSPKASGPMCSMHATRRRRHGSPQIVIAPADRKVRRGTENSRWLADDVVDYRTVHQRLKRYRGPARNHACSDCGKPAVHWAYDHADHDDERVSPEGVPYSIKPEHYRPLCASCHKMLDHAYLQWQATKRAVDQIIASAEASDRPEVAEFIRSHVERDWSAEARRFVVHGEFDGSGQRAWPTCDGRWDTSEPDGAVA